MRRIGVGMVGFAGTDSNSVKTEFCLFDLAVGMQGRF